MTFKESTLYICAAVIIPISIIGAYYLFMASDTRTLKSNQHSVTPEYNMDFRTSICYAYFPDGNRTQVECTKEVLDLIK
jgi:hypothetical protein